MRVAELPRVVGLLRRQRLRDASRARIQCPPQCRRPDRYLSPVQVSRQRRRCHPPGEPRHHPRRRADGRRPGLLHALVRRSRQGDRRWDGGAAGGADIPVDRGRSEPAVASSERRRAARRHRGHLGAGGRAGAAGADLRPRAARRSRGGHRRPAVLPRDQRPHRRCAGRHLADGGTPAIWVTRSGYRRNRGWMSGTR